MRPHDPIRSEEAAPDPSPTARRIDPRTATVLLLPVLVPTAVVALILILEITS